MENKEAIFVAQEIRRKLNELDKFNSAASGSVSSSTNNKKARYNSIAKIFRAITILAATTIIVSVVLTVSMNAFNKRQQKLDGKIGKQAKVQVSQLEFNIANEPDGRVLNVRAVIKNMGNAPGTVARASFRLFNADMELITSWPSPLPFEPIIPQGEKVIESRFYEPPDEVESIELILEKVVSQK